MFNVTTTVNYVNQCLFNNIATFSRLNNNLNPFKRKSLKFDNWMNINSNYGVVLHPFLVPIICFLFPDVSFKRWNDETWSMMLNVINQITEQNRSTKSGWKGFWARFGKATDNETTKGKYLEAEKWTNNEHVNVTDRPHEYVDSSTGFRSYQFQSFSHQSFAFPSLITSLGSSNGRRNPQESSLKPMHFWVSSSCFVVAAQMNRNFVVVIGGVELGLKIIAANNHRRRRRREKHIKNNIIEKFSVEEFEQCPLTTRKPLFVGFVDDPIWWFHTVRENLGRTEEVLDVKPEKCVCRVFCYNSMSLWWAWNNRSLVWQIHVENRRKLKHFSRLIHH